LTKFMMIVMMAILPLSFYAQKKQSAPVERYFYLFAEGGLSVNHTDLANYGGVPFNFETKKLEFLKSFLLLPTNLHFSYFLLFYNSTVHLRSIQREREREREADIFIK